jgi:hypothetical protein
MWYLILIIVLCQLGWLMPVVVFGVISIAVVWVLVKLIQLFDW